MKKQFICGKCMREFNTWLEVADHICKAPNSKEHKNATT